MTFGRDLLRLLATNPHAFENLSSFLLATHCYICMSRFYRIEFSFANIFITIQLVVFVRNYIQKEWKLDMDAIRSVQFGKASISALF